MSAPRLEIRGDQGAVDHAWLDGALLHETCASYRFRLTIGESGGLVCDAVVGDRPLPAGTVGSIARAAAENADPSHRDPLPLVDPDGGPASVGPTGDGSGGAPLPSGRAEWSLWAACAVSAAAGLYALLALDLATAWTIAATVSILSGCEAWDRTKTRTARPDPVDAETARRAERAARCPTAVDAPITS